MVIGDRKTELLHFGDQEPRYKTGTVVWIHPERRFYTVEFDMGMGRTVRENYYFPSRAGTLPDWSDAQFQCQSDDIKRLNGKRNKRSCKQ